MVAAVRGARAGGCVGGRLVEGLCEGVEVRVRCDVDDGEKRRWAKRRADERERMGLRGLDVVE